MAKQAPLTGRQRRLTLAIIAAYTYAYIGRMNLAMALTSLMGEMNLSNTQGGMFATLFAISYAVGQVINGVLADRVNPRRWVMLGLAGSALCNGLMAIAGGYSAMLAAWCLNGVFQSMLWSPLVRIIAVEYEAEKRERVSFLLSLSLISGYLLAWGISLWLSSSLGWRWAFGVPAAILALGSASLIWGLGDVRGGRVIRDRETGGGERRNAGGLLSVGLLMVLFAAMINGFVRDSVINWAPTILAQTASMDLDSAMGMALIIPMFNAVGILFGKYCLRRLGGRVRVSLSVLLGFGAAASLACVGVYRLCPALCVLPIALCAAAVYGANPILTTLVPLEFSQTGRVGTVAGLLDGCIYLGSSLSGVVTGLISDRSGWMAVFLLWTAAALADMFVFALSAKARKER